MEMPNALEMWTLDEVAECLSISRGLRARLWALMPSDDAVPPAGEWPEPDSANRKVRFLAKRWPELTEQEKKEIADAYAKEFSR